MAQAEEEAVVERDLGLALAPVVNRDLRGAVFAQVLSMVVSTDRLEGSHMDLPVAALVWDPRVDPWGAVGCLKDW